MLHGDTGTEGWRQHLHMDLKHTDLSEAWPSAVLLGNGDFRGLLGGVGAVVLRDGVELLVELLPLGLHDAEPGFEGVDGDHPRDEAGKTEVD